MKMAKKKTTYRKKRKTTAKKRTRKPKVYRTKAEALDIADRQGGRNRVYKISSGWRVSRVKKRK